MSRPIPVNPIVDGYSLRGRTGERIEYHSADGSMPWRSFRNGTAGRHFGCEGAARAYGFKLETRQEHDERLNAMEPDGFWIVTRHVNPAQSMTVRAFDDSDQAVAFVESLPVDPATVKYSIRRTHCPECGVSGLHEPHCHMAKGSKRIGAQA